MVGHARLDSDSVPYFLVRFLFTQRPDYFFVEQRYRYYSISPCVKLCRGPGCANLESRHDTSSVSLKCLGLKDRAGKLLSRVPRCIEKIAIN